MTSKGQITVPVEIRRKLGLKKGEKINIKLKGNTAVIEANDWQNDLRVLQKRMSAHLKQHNIKPLSDEELDEAINQASQQAAVERYQRGMRS